MITLEDSITKETPTKDIENLLINLHNELNLLPYLENIEKYNCLEKRKRIIEDILLIRYEKAI